ncbi:nucleotidyl transferase AbiEii/AbiGii toxin family protein [Candidatus Gottesmanbacteria bacterium]|nr:nucleotidyl transferase AbiEii/AbiGii toxin family protein [Candidatus Gottesmanbacteria bacterium]
MEPVILTTDQTSVLQLFSKNELLSKLFYLSGGTALSAFYLHHRYSDDLDFFSDTPFELSVISPFIADVKNTLRTTSPTYEHLYDRHIFIFAAKTILKIEFTLYPFAHLAPFEQKNGVSVDSKLDIAVNKLFALFGRNEPKDFVDLYVLLQQLSLDTLIEGAKKKFDFAISPMTLGSELLKIRHLEMFPRMITPLSKETLIDFFEKKAHDLGNQVVL